MIGIYNEEFIDHLKYHLGDPVLVKVKNIVCRCPWCEYEESKKHYHLWIGLDTPIFRCFHCPAKGTINKLLAKLDGSDNANDFIDRDKLNELRKRNLEFKRNKFTPSEILLPELNEQAFPLKVLYMKNRFKFSNIPLKNIEGLVFDINQFIEMNNLQLDEKVLKFKDYLHNNFVGLLSKHKSCIILRNVDSSAEFRYYKLKIQPSILLDYYKLNGFSKLSKTIVLAEGIFDIYTEHIYDSLKLKQPASLYAAALSTSYQSLLKSLAFHEQIFRQDVHILSDNGIDLRFYQNLKKYNSHLVDSLTVYYNRGGKDFNDTPLIIDKRII
jgi:hypothetical protein